MKEPIDGDCLILSGMEFQTVGGAKWKALRPMAVVVKGTCSRLCEEEHSGHSFWNLLTYLLTHTGPTALPGPLKWRVINPC